MLSPMQKLQHSAPLHCCEVAVVLRDHCGSMPTLLSLNLPPSALIHWLKQPLAEAVVIGVEIGEPAIATVGPSSPLRSGAGAGLRTKDTGFGVGEAAKNCTASSAEIGAVEVEVAKPAAALLAGVNSLLRSGAGVMVACCVDAADIDLAFC